VKIGKIPESVLIRSVLKQVKHRREEVLAGPGVGEDCAALEVGEGEALVLSTDPITGTAKDIGRHGIYVTANDLAVSGAEPIGVLLTVILPPDVPEEELKKIIKDGEETCKGLHMEILGGHTEVSKIVSQPLLSVTGVGKVKKTSFLRTSGMKPNQDLVVTKWIGLEGTAILAKEKEEELRKRFPSILVHTARDFSHLLSVIEEARIATEHGVSAMHDITEGGIFGALWEMASGAGVGLEVDLKKIPIRQETVEICEYFGLNPYQLMSSGSILAASDDGYELVRKLEQAGIHAVVVGRTNGENDRILYNGEDVRYLDKPQPDELYRI